MIAHVQDQKLGRDYALYQGDCCQVIHGIPNDSVDGSLYSPPFEGLYTYSDSEADMGNCASSEEFFTHYRFLIRELYRVTKPGRLSIVHCKDLPLYKGRDGAAGLRDFPGQIIRAHEEEGWTYHSRVTIWKDPVIEMQRTKNHGLLYKNLKADSCGSRQGMADYVVVFRKWSEGVEKWPDPVLHTEEEFPLPQWQRWASPVWDQVELPQEWEDYALRAPSVAGTVEEALSLMQRGRALFGQFRQFYSRFVTAFRDATREQQPVWMDIDQTNVLNYQIAKGNGDEKHICPLQLGLIHRCLRLWTKPGDLVLSPFAGIGSEGYEALKLGRRFIGIELHRNYWEWACRNLERAANESAQGSLFDLAGV